MKCRRAHCQSGDLRGFRARYIFMESHLLNRGTSAGLKKLSDQASRRSSFYGQLVPTPNGQTYGYGYFLLPQPPKTGQSATTAPKSSGAVLFGPKL